MQIQFVRACPSDAETVIELQNEAFRGDFERYGQCPNYGRSQESTEGIIRRHYDFMIFADERPVGNMIVKLRGAGECHLTSLAVIPAWQRRGIGSSALVFLENRFPDSVKFTLDTPEDKIGNRLFYQKAGYREIGSVHSSGITCTLLEKAPGKPGH
jgi:ribosomal protein S18 acetylase RimI-like enzyme